MIDLVVGMQYGDEGKGTFCRYLARQGCYDAFVKTCGPNSGHSALINGKRFEFHALPVCCDMGKPCIIPSGAVINPATLFSELEILKGEGIVPMLWISSMASVSKVMTSSEEKFKDTVGSTGMGVGTARAEKVRRKGLLARSVASLQPYINDEKIDFLFSANWSRLHVETGQGFGLSLNYHQYPFCTSSDISLHAELAKLGLFLNRTHALHVFGVCKPYPTRIAGRSGFLYKETTWKELGLAEQRTNLEYHHGKFLSSIARVGRWDDGLMKDALLCLQPHRVCLSYATWLQPNLKEWKEIVPYSALNEQVQLLITKYPWINYLGVDIDKILRVIRE